MVGRALLLAVAALLLVGCSGDDDGAAPTTETTGTTTVTTTVTTPALDGASTDPVTGQGTSSGTALLTDVRAASHAGHNRVVFEFRNGLPGYDVRYVERPIVADGSGDDVPVEGGSVLLVRMEPALDADLTQESAPRTYTGPTRFSPDMTAVVELVRTGGFEAVLVWAVGVDEQRPFRVTRLESPARLVIDIASS